MKITSKIGILIAALLLIISCKKEPVDNNITVSGTIVKDCAGTPYANQSFTYVNLGRGFMEERDEVAFTTDAVGNFEFKCPKRNPSELSEIKIGGSGGFTILEFNPTENLNIGVLNTLPSANFKLAVKILNNSYSLSDTLLVYTHKLVYPFQDTILPVTSNYVNPLDVPALDRKNKVSFRPSYVVYSGVRGQTNYEEKKYDYFQFWLESCSSYINKIEIFIE